MLRTRYFRLLKHTAVASAAALSLIPSTGLAAQYGGGINEGFGLLSGLNGISSSTSISVIIMRIIEFILNLTLILAVAAIIVAGIYLIVSNGDEAQKDKAKKIITYVIIGILIILLARAIVSFVLGLVS